MSITKMIKTEVHVQGTREYVKKFLIAIIGSIDKLDDTKLKTDLACQITQPGTYDTATFYEFRPTHIDNVKIEYNEEGRMLNYPNDERQTDTKAG